MAITALPNPPSRQDPANFSNDADAFLGALPTFATEANALAVEVNDNAESASSDANAAAMSASAAEDSATASENSALASAASITNVLGLTPVQSSSLTITATVGNMYILTGAGTVTVTLPSNPSQGNILAIMPVNNRLDTLVLRNGKPINGDNTNAIIANYNIVGHFYYDGSSWRVF